ncbi:uncharacterized protein K489DRAFT_299442, partial [Dissoconium aciculare CBS 342.82]|uniref:BHLH domain-containing protein n=1 Tax=Dissoconium aciculare CBS 342.82 TaxID=1314786 RepID=A0A6J3MCH0_9PEZI
SGNQQAKPRLTEEEKRQNHIASEKKRRDAIRAGFDSLCDIVPTMKGQGRSEAVVLGKTVEFVELQLAFQESLKEIALSNGWSEDKFKQFYLDAEKESKEKQKTTAAGQAR